MNNPDCYKCKYRSNVPGDRHSQCLYPGNEDTLLTMFGIHTKNNVNNAIQLNIMAAAHGVSKGWFNWPMNFDPIWLRNCDGFQSKQNENA